MYEFHLEEACAACGKATHHACDRCKQPFDDGCLFQTGKMLTFDADPHNEDFAEHPTWSREERLCLVCYVETKKHAPLVLWQDTSAETTLLVFGMMIKQGVMAPAGDGVHAWYKPPTAEKMLTLRWGNQTIELDVFRVVQLLDFLKANEPMIREQAKAASDILVPHERKMTEAAIRADLGITDFAEE